MKICTVSIFIIIEIFTNIDSIFSQTENEDQVKYYQMEPLDDSLFIQIQEELSIESILHGKMTSNKFRPFIQLGNEKSFEASVKQ